MPERIAIKLPGGLGGPYVPTLMFAADAAERRGATVHSVWWEHGVEPSSLPAPERIDWVRQQVRAELSKHDQPLMIAKSLGTVSAPLAAEFALPAVWITPLIKPGLWYGDAVVQGLRKATAPCLLIGGTADPSWDGDLARELSPHVFEIEGADHGLYVPGPLAASAEALGRMATAVERFLDEVLWPAPDPAPAVV